MKKLKKMKRSKKVEERLHDIAFANSLGFGKDNKTLNFDIPYAEGPVHVRISTNVKLLCETPMNITLALMKYQYNFLATEKDNKPQYGIAEIIPPNGKGYRQTVPLLILDNGENLTDSLYWSSKLFTKILTELEASAASEEKNDERDELIAIMQNFEILLKYTLPRIL